MPTRRPSLLYRLRHYIEGPNPLHPAVWEERLSPITFRRFQEADIPACLEIYKLNEPGRFPEGVIAEYEKCLREQTSYFMVAEKNGRVVATGGISYFQKPHVAMLCFGLIRPENQGAGIGAASLLARLALLKKDQPAYRVLICAVAKSFGYYQRFGFQLFGNWPDPHGQNHPLGALTITHEEVQQCRKLLTDHGISFPQDEDQVPLRTIADEAAKEGAPTESERSETIKS
jgi:N-acetylglutamate synthase-like GNAT family acetyltransferase